MQFSRSKYRKRHLIFSRFFTVSQPHSLCYCSDIFGVFNEIGIDYNPADWRLFIDSSELSALERDAWQSFRNAVHGFLGRNKADNYEELVETLLQTYCKLGSRMSLKMHYLHSHLDIFQAKFGRCERRAWRTFSSRYSGDGEEVPRSMG